MKKLLCCAVILAMFPVCGLFAQIPLPPGNFPSPNAASLGIFGEFPVSYFTGLPQIGIPLYELKNGNLKVPISINYHASGFRPDQHPGWVGMGWNLDAGGIISRTVHDMPDEYNNPNYGTYGTNMGFYYNYSILNPANWASDSYMQTISRTDQMLKDTEPDEFSFRLPSGISGKFYRDHLGGWKAQSDRPVKITFNGTFLDVPFLMPSDSPYNSYGYFKSFNGFTITDEGGVQYVFGGTTDGIEYSEPFFGQYPSEWIADSWYLTKIIHPYGDQISFSYTRGNFINQMYISVNNNIGTSTVTSGGFLQPSCSSWSYNNIGASYGGQLVSPIYLSMITAGNEQVKFNSSTSTELRYPQSAYDYQYSLWSMYSSSTFSMFLPFLENTESDTYPTCLNNLQWRKLDQVRVEVGGVLQKAYNFSYSNSSTQRLTLLSLTEVGKSGSLLKPYTFTYNTSVSLPAYLANMTDHWGFYNGTYADISNQSTYYNTYYNYRNPNASYLQAGTISRITYPTGGVTDFTFEPHYYRKEVPEQRDLEPTTLTANTLAGGLRIRKISSYDANIPDQKVEKEYFYVDGYNSSANVSTLPSSGILGEKAKYYFDDYRVKSYNDNVTYSQALFSSQSVLPASLNSQGSHIGYSTVIEKRNDGSYKKFNFSNFDDYSYRDQAPITVLQPSRTIYGPYSSRANFRGKLLKQLYYRNDDVLLEKKEYLYGPVGLPDSDIRSVKALHFSVCPLTGVSVEEGVSYVFNVSALPITYELVDTYDQNGGNLVTNSTVYNYDNSQRVLRYSQHEDSKLNTTKVYYRYCFDVSTGSPSGTVTPNAYPVQWMKNNFMIGQPLEILTTFTALGGVEQVTAAQAFTFGGNTNPNTVFLKAQYNLDIIQPFARSGYISYSVNSATSGEPATMDSHLKLTNEYTYSSFSPASGQYVLRLSENRPYRTPITSYIWGYGDKLPVAEAKNTEQTEAAYSSFETSEKGNWSYSGSTTTDGTAPTGKYAYHLSGGAISRSGLTSTKKYLLTYWAKSASATAISGGTATVVRTYNGWTQYSRVITGITSLTISGTVAVDEVRLYNFEGDLNTYTYNELGAITTETDGKGYTKYYTYDEFNRLVTVKDNDGHLLEDYTYHLR